MNNKGKSGELWAIIGGLLIVVFIASFIIASSEGDNSNVNPTDKALAEGADYVRGISVLLLVVIGITALIALIIKLSKG